MEKITFHLMKLYFEHLIEFRNNLSTNNFLQLLQKIKEDKIKLTLSFQPFAGEDITLWLFPLTTLLEFLQKDNLESIRTSLIRIFAYFGNICH